MVSGFFFVLSLIASFFFSGKIVPEFHLLEYMKPWDGQSYRELLSLTFLQELGMLKSSFFVWSVFTGAIWFAIIAIVCRFTRVQCLWGVVAIMLGMVSGMMTLFVVTVQDHHSLVPFDPRDDVVKQLIGLIAGIGLREETIKIVFFLPMLIVLSRMERPFLRALGFGAMVGLGFAIGENVSYFSDFLLGDVTALITPAARLCTANPVHFCLTGYLAYAVFRCVKRKGRHWDDMLLDFLIVVIAHAVYDGLLMMPAVGEYGALSVIVVALIAYRFFDRVGDVYDNLGSISKIGPLGIYVLGTCGIIGATFVQAALFSDWQEAFVIFLSCVAAMFPTAFAFIHRLKDY
ncbi:MAG: PrsW family glutamic-type intramembrane protease [Verrucomicrobiota bacterium]